MGAVETGLALDPASLAGSPAPGTAARELLRLARLARRPFRERMLSGAEMVEGIFGGPDRVYMRVLERTDARSLDVLDPAGPGRVPSLMFGSSDYLGLCRHPDVLARAGDALERYGMSMTGSPILNGYTVLHRALEERIAAYCGYEDALLFPSGFAANLGWVQSLVRPNDTVIYDEYSHTSLREALRGHKRGHALAFDHNDLSSIEQALDRADRTAGSDVFVFVEGLYSMDGDIAPLPELVGLARRRGCVVAVDDAHAIGVLGAAGSGTFGHFGLPASADIAVGTLSKALGAVGGFVCGSAAMTKYMRATASAFMFSASLPPPVAAAALAAIDVIEREPERVARLQHVVRYARGALAAFEPMGDPASPILPVQPPASVGARSAARRLQARGIFVNAVLFPAVSLDKERLRITLSSEHAPAEIDRLREALADIWAEDSAECR